MKKCLFPIDALVVLMSNLIKKSWTDSSMNGKSSKRFKVSKFELKLPSKQFYYSASPLNIMQSQYLMSQGPFEVELLKCQFCFSKNLPILGCCWYCLQFRCHFWMEWKLWNFIWPSINMWKPSYFQIPSCLLPRFWFVL